MLELWYWLTELARLKSDICLRENMPFDYVVQVHPKRVFLLKWFVIAKNRPILNQDIRNMHFPISGMQLNLILILIAIAVATFLGYYSLQLHMLHSESNLDRINVMCFTSRHPRDHHLPDPLSYVGKILLWPTTVIQVFNLCCVIFLCTVMCIWFVQIFSSHYTWEKCLSHFKSLILRIWNFPSAENPCTILPESYFELG